MDDKEETTQNRTDVKWHQSAVELTRVLTQGSIEACSGLAKALTHLLKELDAGVTNAIIDFVAFGLFIYLCVTLKDQFIADMSLKHYLVFFGLGLFGIFAFTVWCIKTCFLKEGRIKDSSNPNATD